MPQTDSRPPKSRQRGLKEFAVSCLPFSFQFFQNQLCICNQLCGRCLRGTAKLGCFAREQQEHDIVDHAVRHPLLRQQLGEGELPRRYGAVSMLDVLEHLEDPLAGLRAAYQALEDGGCLLLSVPNIGHWRIVSDLLAGRFDYSPVGILCITHLRFFTASSLRTLLDEAGFRVESWRNAGLPLQPAMRQVLSAARAAGLAVDEESLGAEVFHVLARRD